MFLIHWCVLSLGFVESQELEKALRSPDVHIRISAAEKLVGSKNVAESLRLDATQVLKVALHDDDAEARIWAAVSLLGVRSHVDLARAVIAQDLRKGTADTRKGACVVLRYKGASNAVPEIVSAAKEEVLEVDSALIALADCDGELIETAFLEHALGKASTGSLPVGVRLLRNSKDPLPALSRLLKSRRPELREAVLEGLRDGKDASAELATAVCAIAKDGQELPRVRMRAIESLKTLGVARKPYTLTVLVELLRDHTILATSTREVTSGEIVTLQRTSSMVAAEVIGEIGDSEAIRPLRSTLDKLPSPQEGESGYTFSATFSGVLSRAIEKIERRQRMEKRANPAS